MSATAFQRKRRELAAKAAEEAAKKEENKPFEKMNAGEQIAFIDSVKTIEELEALRDKTPKATALTAIENKINAIRDAEEATAKAEKDEFIKGLSEDELSKVKAIYPELDNVSLDEIKKALTPAGDNQE